MKKSVKKLSLSKMTISNLDASEMNLVNGGAAAKPSVKVPLTKQATCTQSNAVCNFSVQIAC